MKNLLIAVLFIFTLISVNTVPCLASDITNANFVGTILITNNSSTTTVITSNVTNLSTTALINGGFVNSYGNNTVMRSASGADVAFMPGYGSTAWMTYVPSISGNSSINYLLYTGNVYGGDIAYFPGTGGMVTNDVASMELGSNFSIETSGLWTTGTQRSKPGAFSIDYGSTVSGNVTGSINSLTNLKDNQTAVGGGGSRQTFSVNWEAQTITPSANYIITGVSVYLFKNGAPAGNYIVGITATSGGNPVLPLLTTSTIAANSIPAGPGWNDFIFTTPLFLTSGTTYAIVTNCVAGDAGNNISWYYELTNPYAGGTYTESLDSGATWTPIAAADYSFKCYSGATVSYSMTSAEHVVKVYADGTDLKLDIDTVNVASTALGGASVPNNTNAWTDFASGMPYVYYISTSVGGGVRQYIDWEYTSGTLTDSSGWGNNPASTPYAVNSSDADVIGRLVSFLPVAEADAPAYSLSSAPNLINTTPVASGNFTTSLNPNFPGAELVIDVAAVSGTPSQYPFILIFSFIILTIGILITWLMRQHSQGSIFIKGIIITVIMGFAVSLRVFDIWMVVMFAIFVISVAMASKTQWG